MPSKSKRQHNFMEAVAHNKAFAKKVGVPQSVGEDFAKADKGKHFKKGGINMATKKRSVNPAMAMMAARAMPTPAAAPMAAPAGPMAGGMKHGGLSKEHHKHLAHHHLAMAEHHMAQHEGHKHGGKIHKMAHGGKAHHESEKMHELNQAKELRRIAKEEESEAKHMKHGGKAHMKKYAHGGAIKREASTEHRGHFKEKETMGPRGMKEDVEKGSNKLGRFGESKVQKRGHTEDRKPKMHDDGYNDIGTSGSISGKKHGGHIKKMASGGSTSSRADGIAKRGHTKTKYC